MSATSAGCDDVPLLGALAGGEAARHQREAEAAVQQQRALGNAGEQVHAGSVADRRWAFSPPAATSRTSCLGVAARQAQADVQRRGRVAAREAAAQEPFGRLPGLRPGRGGLVDRLAEVDDQRDLAADGGAVVGVRPGDRVVLAELRQAAAQDLLVDLGELAAHGRAGAGQLSAARTPGCAAGAGRSRRRPRCRRSGASRGRRRRDRRRGAADSRRSGNHRPR